MLSLNEIEKELNNKDEILNFLTYDVLNDFGLQIAGILIKEDMSMHDLATKLSMKDEELYDIIQGGKEDITLKEIIEIAYTLRKQVKINI